MQAKKVSKVTIVQTLKGNVEASEKIERTRRAGTSSSGTRLSYVQGPDGKMVSQIPERYIFDAHTQEPVHATGEMVDGDPVTREGIEFKWPFMTEKRDYEYFDAQTRTSAPIHYKGTRNFRGVKVYYFEQTIPWTKVPFPKDMPDQGHHPGDGRRDRHRPAGTPPSACSGSNRSPAHPSTARRSTRRNCAAARSWATATR